MARPPNTSLTQFAGPSCARLLPPSSTDSFCCRKPATGHRPPAIGHRHTGAPATDHQSRDPAAGHCDPRNRRCCHSHRCRCGRSRRNATAFLYSRALKPYKHSCSIHSKTSMLTRPFSIASDDQSIHVQTIHLELREMTRVSMPKPE